MAQIWDYGRPFMPRRRSKRALGVITSVIAATALLMGLMPAAFAETDAPTVTNVVATPDPQDVGQDVDVSADVTDATDVATVEYSLDGGAWASMTEGSPDAWSATIVSPALGSHEACIRATDTETTPNVSDGTDCVKFDVVDMAYSYVTNVVATPASQTYDGDIVVTADVTDVTGIDTVEYSVDGGTPAPMTGTAPAYTATISSPDVGLYEVCVQVTDLTPFTTDGSACASFEVTPVELTAVLTAVDKDYDGTMDADATCDISGDVDYVSPDDVECDVDSASFDDPNVGTQTVDATVSLSGDDAGNYVLDDATISDDADIDPAELTAELNADDKTYDGTTAATATCDIAADANYVSPDDVECDVDSASFDDPNVGPRTVDATVSLSGDDAGNYMLDDTTISDDAAITKALLGIVYSGTGYFTSGNINLQATVSGVCKSGQVVTYTLDTDGDGDFSDETAIGSATTNSAGLATFAYISPTGTVWDLQVSVAESPNCAGAIGTAVVIVASSGDASNGGGNYNNAGRMNLGYSIQVKTDKKTGYKTVSGQILWQKQGATRFKGVITGYTLTTCPGGVVVGSRCALITGSGSTYTWNSGTGDWDLDIASTSFKVIVADGLSANVCTTPKKCTTVQYADYFGLYFPFTTVDGESGTTSPGLPDVYLLKGGSIVVK